MAFPGVRDIRIAPARRRRVRRRDHHGMRRPAAHGRQRPRALLRRQHRPSSRATPATDRSTGSIAGAAACAEMVFDLVRALGRAADENHRHAHLPGDPHRHRIVPLLEHLAENVRHLPGVPGSRSRPGAGRAQRLRQQQHGPAEAVRRGPGRDANRSDAAASPSSTSITRWRAPPAAPTRTPRDSINLPLTVKEIEAVVFFKQEKGDQYRVSLRSKGNVDIGAIAKEYGGGGHKNASGCTVSGPDRRAAEGARRKDRGRHRWTGC